MGVIQPRTQKVPVSKRALLARLNRRLAKDGEIIKGTGGTKGRRYELGEYYCISLARNTVTDTHVDLEAWARELAVLRPYERLEEDA
jgi:hypothetical protein